MTIYLYKKTHNKTGLQYLGKTTRDPYKYKGSGLVWENHINKYGDDIRTEILKECKDNDEVSYWGTYYSNLWNVVGSAEWANLKPESGEGGFTSDMVRKALETKKKNGTLRPKRESIQKMVETRKKKGLYKQTPENIQKALATKRKNGTLNNITPESIQKGLETRRRTGKMNVTTPESIKKGLETRRKNGTVNTNTAESIAKALETKRKNGTMDPTKIKACCIHCRKELATPHLARFHGEKCRNKS